MKNLLILFLSTLMFASPSSPRIRSVNAATNVTPTFAPTAKPASPGKTYDYLYDDDSQTLHFWHDSVTSRIVVCDDSAHACVWTGQRIDYQALWLSR